VRFSDEARTLARASPAAFATVTSRGRYLPDEHLVRLDEELTALAFGANDRLLVSMPPRHGKSETISRYLPAWYLGRFPERRVMLASYGSEFAASWGQKARELVREFGEELFGIRLSQTAAAAAAWELERTGGGMTTAGVGGALTGKGAHLLVIDDPVKNAEEAQSKTVREKHWEWYRSTAYSRLEPGGVVVIVMTRWHEDDLAGRLLAAGDAEGERWRHLRLPAIAEQGDALGRTPGEPLWPERYPLKRLREIERTLGSYWWEALYQQRPGPLEGGIFKRQNFRHFSADKEVYVLASDEGPRAIGKSYCRVFATVDVADSQKTSADYTVVSTWAATPSKDLLLLDRERVRFEGPDLPRVVREAYEKWRPAQIKIEQATFGHGLIRTLLREGLPVVALSADADKVTRALSAAALYEAHKIYHPRSAPWLSEWEQELLAFPNGAHDDQVDTVAYAARALPSIGFGARFQKHRGETITGGLLGMEF
jgi:predicted phage terminase large subunit-like protein